MRKAVMAPTVLTPSKRMTLTLLAASLVGMVVLLGVGIRTAQTQTTTSASTTTYYKVQDLGTLPGATYSPPTSAAYGINDSGHVVGSAALYGGYVYEGWGDPYYLAFNHAFLYDGSMKDLGILVSGFLSGATAINSTGQVVGNSVDSSYVSHAFLYKDGVMKELSTLGAIMSSSGIEPGPDNQAFGINDSGQVVGLFQVYGTDYYANNYHAYLYDSESATPKMIDLGILGGTYTNYYSNSQANGINNKGQVVGWSAYGDSNHHHAFLYDSAHGMKDLGDLGEHGGTNSYAYGINNKGQVVGQAQYVDGGAWHAYLYDSESATPKMIDLGTLGGTNSSAYDINDSGQVVGYSANDQSNTPYNHAFLYDSESATPKMIDLGTRTHPDQNGNVWDLGAARDINNKGQIVIDGSRIDPNGTNVYSALLLTPTQDPPPADTQAPPAPTISSPQNDTNDTDGSFSVSGSAEAGSIVELFEGTTSKGKTRADSPAGGWSIDLSGVSEGTHTYSAKAIDAAGNTSSASNTVTVTVDTQAPTAPTISSPQNDTNDTDGSFSVSGSAEADSTVELFEGTTSKGTTEADSSGAWSIALEDVSNGSHTYSAKATDAAGNTSSASNTITVMVGLDTTKPSTSATPSVQPNAAGWNNKDVTVALKATDNQGGWGVKKITYSASGDQTIAQTDASADSVNVALDKEGTTTLTYYATDKAGNVEDEKSLQIKIDKTPPSVDGNSISPKDNTTVSPSATISVTYLESGSGINPSTLTQGFMLFRETRVAGGGISYESVSGNVGYDAKSKTATFTPRTKLSKGKYFARTNETVKDNAGNASNYKEWKFSVG